ncbi:MAG: ferrochelatase [Pseudomonadota bacterium]
MSRKLAVVLLNLGGPDTRENIRPFLQNLFADPAIIRAPTPLRWLLSRIISRTRAPAVAKNYALMNQPEGGSPLLPETRKQADALAAELSGRLQGVDVKCFIAMRYWHPFTHEAAAAVTAWAPDEVVVLPLYPQFSSTTTASSLGEWQASYDGPYKTVCCYPFNPDFIAAHRDKIMDAWRVDGSPGNVKLLMSAHGVPEQVIRDGDPYQWQVEKMAGQLSDMLPDDWDKQVCYQSRVGPLKWIGPATEEEIETAALAGQHIVIAPIAFVSDHIETLVELGEEYREIAEENNAVGYTNVPALGVLPIFIRTLANEVMSTLDGAQELRSCAGGRICPSGFNNCPFEGRQLVEVAPEEETIGSEAA